jgi:sugar/nucleoside kinase (ribokinase family)
MSISVLGVGDLTIDIILGPMADMPRWGSESEVATADFRLGGNLGNFAVAARVLGLDVLCAGPIGDDDNGLRVRRDLATIGCRTELIRTVPGGKTCVSIGFVRDDGERLFVTYTGVLKTLADFVRETRPPRTDVAFFSGWCQPPRVDAPTLRRCFARLSDQKTPIVVDLSWSTETWDRKGELLEMLRHADFVLLNKDELAAIVDLPTVERGLAALAEALGERPAVIVKRGPDGAASKRGSGRILHAKAPPVTAASAVGAGDSFNAAFVAGTFERHLDLEGATAYACTFASSMMQTGRPKSIRDLGAAQPGSLAHGD